MIWYVTGSRRRRAICNQLIFPKGYGRRIARAEEIRHASDYDDFYIATKEKAEEQILTAGELIELIEKYCLGRMED